jgi:hypothetical protein
MGIMGWARMADYWNLRHAGNDERGERRVVDSEEWRVESEVYEPSGAPESNLGSRLNSAPMREDDPGSTLKSCSPTSQAAI